MTSAADVNAAYRNNTTLSWDAMLNDLLIAFGIDSGVIPKLWQKPDVGVADESESVARTRRLSPIHATLDHYKSQMLPGERLDKFSDSLLGHISDLLCWDAVYKRFGAKPSKISLNKFCGEVLVEALSRAMFGNRIFEVEPDLVQSMLDFNDDAWMLIFQYPQSSESKLHRARRKLLDFFLRYMQGPEELRSEQAWMIDRAIQDLKAIDMCDEDRAPLLLMIYWG